MKSAVKFEHVLKDHLSDPDQAAKYLTACYEEGSDVFLQALRDVVGAPGGITRAARLHVQVCFFGGAGQGESPEEIDSGALKRFTLLR